MAANVQVDWKHWLQRWDAQQAGYVPEREERFRVMLDVLEALLPDEFVALDLACGPGAISQRLLERFPRSPLRRDRHGPGDARARTGRARDLRWSPALDRCRSGGAQAGWSPSARRRVDAVLSTTALHWLSGEHLVALYRQLGALVRPGGVFLNGDNMDFGPDLPTIQRFAQDAQRSRLDG